MRYKAILLDTKKETYFKKPSLFITQNPFASNDFLSLARQSEVCLAALKASRKRLNTQSVYVDSKSG